MSGPSIYLHTNIPAPYRQHQFEAIAAAFAGTKVFFSEGMHPDRTWAESVSEWKVPCRRFKHQIVLPNVGRVTPGLIPELLRQPLGTIHLFAGSFGHFLLLRAVGRRRGGGLSSGTTGDSLRESRRGTDVGLFAG